MAYSKKRKRILVFSSIGAVLVVLTLVAILRKKDPVITVQAEKVTRRDLVERVVATGKIQPVTQVVISPEVSGEIIDLAVKEGQRVWKGDLLLKIKPDFYLAAFNQAKAGYESSVASKEEAAANLVKANADFKRNNELFNHKLISEADFIGFKAAFEVAQAQLESATHQVDVARATVDSAQDSLDKTTIVSPLTGTISKLNSQLGERVLGTVQNVGTEIMTVADLSEMEARVDVGEVDVVLIATNQIARLEVDAFKDRKFAGMVTGVAKSANGLGQTALSTSSSSTDATKFEVHIRITEKESFLPGMSVTAEIETRYRTNVLTVPIASLTTRMPKEPKKDGGKGAAATNATTKAKAKPAGTNSTVAKADPLPAADTNAWRSDKKSKETKPIEVVFVVDGDHARMLPVKSGISDDDYYEITEGLKDGQEVVSGGFKAISRDLEDGKKIVKGPANPAADTKEP
jgi:HlyD family secretion protein